MYDFAYILLVATTLIFGLASSAYVSHQIRKYSKVPVSNGLTGAEIAWHMLNYHNIRDVVILQGGPGEDHYDPRRKTISLSPDAYVGRSITAAATACHEAGHACQHALDYGPMKVRSVILPVVSFASNAWIFLLMLGIFLNIVGLINLAIILYACAVLFHIVTLPIEFNASKRAMGYMNAMGMNAAEQAS
ncbi:MAG: zinc metallopeptidase, partial [Eggerthellaceae bacterium]|nr:zinc metallopeptidase [Eggerthellaceae bacterium]